MSRLNSFYRWTVLQLQRDVILILAIVGSYLMLTLMMIVDFGDGGSDYKQGDWLINNVVVAVRRGPVGSWIIGLSDLLGLSPLAAVMIIQWILLTALYVVVTAILLSLRHKYLNLILISSPALFLVFWLADSGAGFRKELIAYVAITLAILNMKSDSRALFAAACVIFVAGCYGHEINVMLSPLFFLVAGLNALKSGRFVFYSVMAALVGIAVLHAAFFAVTHLRVEDAMLVCQPLLDRGMGPEICGGAIAWLDKSSSYAMSSVAEVLSPYKVAGFVLAYALSLSPYLYAASHFRHGWLMAALVIVAGLPFLPLFALGSDWGRWVGVHAFSAFAVLLAAISSGMFQMRENLRQEAAPLVFAGLALVYAPYHMIGLIEGGLIASIFGQVADLL